MVYYGVLSKGCQKCRKRKVKCDQGKPHCLRCQKAGIVCPGYRDLSEVTFRDENVRIIRRVRKHDAPADGLNNPRLDRSRSTSTDLSVSSASTPPMSTSMFPPLKDLAMHFYLARCGSDEPPLSPEYCAWIRQSFVDQKDIAMCSAMEAVGLASLANIYFAPDVAEQAQKQYNQALTATAKRLHNPVEAGEDATLFTVIMLSVFEFVNFDCFNPNKSLPWLSHIDGAITLMKLRDYKTSPRRQQLCALLRASILYACMHSDGTICKEYHEAVSPLRRRAISEYGDSIRSSPMGDLCLRLLKTRASMEDGSRSTAEQGMEQLLALNADLAQWKVNMSLVWGYDVVDATPAELVECFNGKRHVYTNLWTAQFWNNWRALRLLVAHDLIDVSITLGRLDGPSLAAHIDVIREMANDICIAAPSIVKTSRAAILIWPLSVVAQDTLGTAESRLWAMKQLRLISAESGIRQPARLAESYCKNMLNEGYKPFPSHVLEAVCAY